MFLNLVCFFFKYSKMLMTIFMKINILKNPHLAIHDVDVVAFQNCETVVLKTKLNVHLYF